MFVLAVLILDTKIEINSLASFFAIDKLFKSVVKFAFSIIFKQTKLSLNYIQWIMYLQNFKLYQILLSHKNVLKRYLDTY